MSAITAIRAYRHWQPFAEGSYGTSGGSAEGFDAVVVAVDTASGVTGWGEMAPLGSFYSDAFAAGARAGVAELAPQLLGMDAAQPRALARRMGALLRGHPYVRSAIDMACWDAAARERGQPLCEALGGRFGDTVELYRSVPPLAVDDAAGQGQTALVHGLGNELELNGRRKGAQLLTAPEQLGHRLAAFLAVVAREVVHVHADEAVGEVVVEATAELLRVRHRASPVREADLDRLAEHL